MKKILSTIETRKKIGLFFIIVEIPVIAIFALLISEGVDLSKFARFCFASGIVLCGIGIYFQSVDTTEYDKKMYIISAVSLLLAIIISFSGGISCSLGKEKIYTCQVCKRTFDGGTSDSKSIYMNNMCVQCYKNFQWATGK